MEQTKNLSIIRKLQTLLPHERVIQFLTSQHLLITEAVSVLQIFEMSKPDVNAEGEVEVLPNILCTCDVVLAFPV
jgi:hypothetical protein